MRESGESGSVKRMLANGAMFKQLHYNCCPDKGAEWAKKASMGYAFKEWAREMELDDSLYDGEAVFPEYNPQFHAFAGSFPIVPGSTYVSGSDCGTAGLDMAFVLLQITPEKQIQALCEVVPMGKEPAEMFFERVTQLIGRRYPTLHGRIHHWGDPTGATKSPVGLPAFDIAAQKGMYIKPSTNQWHIRQAAVVWALTDWITPMIPRFCLSTKDCPVLAEAFAGAYEWRVRGGARAAMGPGRELMTPSKNSFSHCADGGQYALVAARQIITGADSKVVNRVAKSRFNR